MKPDSASELERAVANRVAEDQSLATCVTQRTLLITEDRLENALLKDGPRIGRGTAWVAPLGLVVGLLIALAGSDFRSFLLPATAWKTLVVVGALAAAVWLAVAVHKSRQSLTPEEFLAKLLSANTARGTVPSPIVRADHGEQLPGAAKSAPAPAADAALQCSICGTLLKPGLRNQPCPNCGTIN